MNGFMVFPCFPRWFWVVAEFGRGEKFSGDHLHLILDKRCRLVNEKMSGIAGLTFRDPPLQSETMWKQSHPSKHRLTSHPESPIRVSFSSACTTKRFSSPRCASAIQIVCPLESIAETQPQLQPALLRLSAMVSQYFTRRICLFYSPHGNDKMILTNAMRHAPAFTISEK